MGGWPAWVVDALGVVVVLAGRRGRGACAERTAPSGSREPHARGHARPTTSATPCPTSVAALRATVPARRRPGGRRRQPGRHRWARRRARRGRPAGPRAAPRRQAGPGHRVRRGLRVGAGARATTSSSRWTRTARTARWTCRVVLGALGAPTSSSGPAGCPAGGSSTGRGTARCSPGSATPTPASSLGLPLRDSTGGFRAYRATVLRGVGLADVSSQGLLLPGRHGTARAASAATGSWRCRSPSSSASRAGRR